mgnify:CR=1 FL=1
MDVGQSHFFLAVHSDHLTLTGQGTDNYQPSFESSLNEWHHYVIGYHGQTGDVDVWADGRFVGSGNVDINPSRSSNQPFRIGFLPNAGAMADETMIVDDVSVFNRSLSDDEVIELYTRSAVVVTPESNQDGTTTIAVTVEDGGLDNDLATTGDNATTSQSFEVTVNPVNDLPTLDGLADLTIDEDASEQTVNLAGISAGGGESQALRVTATSSNTALIAAPAVSYTSANPTGTVSFTPLAGNYGSGTITVTVEDGGLDNELATTADNAVTTRTFDVTVSPVNDDPTLDPVPENPPSSSWRQLGSDIDGKTAGEHSGYSVSLSTDGSTVAIGASYGRNESESGHVRINRWADGSWKQLGSDID